MKIATYNIWNHSDNFLIRTPQLLREIIDSDADIIALQEVPPYFYDQHLKQLPEYPYCEFRQYTGQDEGLALLSKYPVMASTFLYDDLHGNCHALHIIVQFGSVRLSVMNLHLPWDSIIAQENQIVLINEFIDAQKPSADYFILLGDFNCGIDSSVHRFLTGNCSLGNKEAKPCWLDVFSTFTCLHGMPLLPTLDCINNPRWKGKNTIYTPENFDRIYVMDNWQPFSFEDANLFGTEINPVSKLCASDHYGVVVELAF